MKYAVFLRKALKAVENRLYSSSASRSVTLQNDLFNAELTKQSNDVGRIEKIIVSYEGKPNPMKFVMNKSISTPFNVAQHLSDWVIDRSALALVDSSTPWDLHRPLDDSCTLRFLTFTGPELHDVNRAFWRSCSFILGAVVQTAFSDNIQVDLHSFPSPQITSGSFTLDARLSLPDWQPSADELRTLSAEMVKLSHQNLPFERLQVTESLALKIFQHNPFKQEQIPDIAKSSGGSITLYRIGTHIDISKGPMVANTSFVGRCSVAAVHQIETEDGSLYRFQGVALPKGLMLNHFAYKILEDRARKPNMKTSVPTSQPKEEAITV